MKMGKYKYVLETGNNEEVAGESGEGRGGREEEIDHGHQKKAEEMEEDLCMEVRRWKRNETNETDEENL